MECSPLAMAFKDVDMKCIPLPPPGTEYERLLSPPPSDHSSQEDKDDKKQDDGTKKTRMTPGAYLEIRNENVVKYLNNSKEHPPTATYKADLPKLWKGFEDSLKLLKRKAVVKPEVALEFGYSSDSSRETNDSFPRNVWETNDSFPRNIGRLQQHDFQVKCYQSMVDHRKKQEKGNGALTNGVIFSHVNFQMILEAKWSLVKMKRLEQILGGISLSCKVDPRWMKFEAEIRKCYGPMDTDSLHFRKLLEAFQMQRWEMIVEMFEEERKMMEKMLKEKRAPSEFPQQLAALPETRSGLEMRISSMSEFQCDQNPYTNSGNMDFWVMPRPKLTIGAYTIRNEETDKFLEFNWPLDGKREIQQVESKEQNQLCVRKGYNAAVFDVGWHYSRMKAFWDTPRQCYLGDHSGNCSHSLDEKKWKRRLLELRGELMDFNPFGVGDTVFYGCVHEKWWFLEDTIIFDNLPDENGGDGSVDLCFPQTLLSNGDGDGENKIIFFDNHFEGVIATPLEMLLRVWARIRFLIDEQPNQLLPLEDFQRIYEKCFGQKFFPLRWGFKNVEDFFQNVHQILPKQITEDVTIVTREEPELEKNDAEIQAKIDAKWASVLENDEDEDHEDDELFDFDLFEELVHEGPWLQEGEVYRVLDY